jgi:hypothetical protein
MTVGCEFYFHLRNLISFYFLRKLVFAKNSLLPHPTIVVFPYASLVGRAPQDTLYSLSPRLVDDPSLPGVGMRVAEQ